MPMPRTQERPRPVSDVVPISARLPRRLVDEQANARALFECLARVRLRPIEADCGVIVLATTPELWTAYIWSPDPGPRVQRIPAPPAAAWLARVVLEGAPFVADGSSPEEHQAAHAGFPWLADATTWRALPIEDAFGTRIGAVVIAARTSRHWASRVERSLREIVRQAGAEIERLWLRASVARLRQELCVAQEVAADARQRRDTMVAVLGHELRNPLAPLTTALELIWQRAPEGLHTELLVMDRQLRLLRRLVDDLLDFSRIFRADLQLDLRRVRLRDVLLSAAEQVHSLLVARGHALVADVPELELEADEARLEQIVLALLSNAAKHTPPGRTITLSARAYDSKVEIVVADDGGMDVRALASAFDPFCGANAAEPGGGGLGLGLPIARALAGRHAGELELRSRGPSSGTEAIVRLPRHHGPSTAGAGGSHRSSVWLPLPRRVLIVDDNRDAADMLADAIRGWGGTPVVAYDAPAALALARDTKFDIALLDIGMPQMNGLELARELRKLDGARDLQIIAVTGFGEPADRERSREAGMDAHLVKPVCLVELRRILTEAKHE